MPYVYWRNPDASGLAVGVRTCGLFGRDERQKLAGGIRASQCREGLLMPPKPWAARCASHRPDRAPQPQSAICATCTSQGWQRAGWRGALSGEASHYRWHSWPPRARIAAMLGCLCGSGTGATPNHRGHTTARCMRLIRQSTRHARRSNRAAHRTKNAHRRDGIEPRIKLACTAAQGAVLGYQSEEARAAEVAVSAWLPQWQQRRKPPYLALMEARSMKNV